MRQIVSDKINSSFTGNKQESEYSFKLNLDSTNLESLNDVTADIFKTLKNISPDAYDNFSFGKYEIDGEANANVRVLGVGYGITNRLMGYVGFPWFKSTVKLKVSRTQGNNHENVVQILKNSGSTTEAQILTNFAQELPDATGEVLQSVVTNYLNYKPIGNWYGEGPGDTELGLAYRLTDWDNSGLAIKLGAILPTGKTDDPDILQDFGFGDGQPDAFVEFGGGLRIGETNLSLDSYTRLTYQFASQKTLRIPENKEYQLGSEKGVFEEKLGNKLEYNLSGTYQFTDWLSLNTGYTYYYEQQSEYNSKYSEANEILEENTEKESHSISAALNFSTIKTYQRGDFFMPLNAGVSGTKIISAMNMPNYTIYTLQLRFFF